MLSPVGSPVKFTVEEMFDEYDNSIDTANHAAMKMSIRSDLTFPEHSIIRMKNSKKPCDFPHMAFVYFFFFSISSDNGFDSMAFLMFSSDKWVYISVVAMLL